MTPRRLILVSEHYQPSSGATAQLMHDLSRGLAELGWNITVLTATSALPMVDANNRHRVVRLGRQQKAADATKSVTGKTLAGLRFLGTDSMASVPWHRVQGFGSTTPTPVFPGRKQKSKSSPSEKSCHRNRK